MPERSSLLLSYRRKNKHKTTQKCDNKIMRCFHYFSSFPEENQSLPLGFIPQQKCLYTTYKIKSLFFSLTAQVNPCLHLLVSFLSISGFCHSITQPVHNATRLLSLLPWEYSITPSMAT